MKKKIHLILFFIAICGLIGGGLSLYMFQKTHDSLLDIDADYRLAASELFHEYEVNESKANSLYLNKVVEISGILAEKSEVGEGEIVLFVRPDDAIFGLSCAFSGADAEAAMSLKEGRQLSIKGICTGMNMDVNLVRCVINE